MTTMNNEDTADQSVHEPLISLEDIRGAVARGWCHPANEHKAMDLPLALAIADEVYVALYAAQQPAPRMAQTTEGRYHDFTLAEAMEIAKRNDPGARVPSASRTFIAEIVRLRKALLYTADPMREAIAAEREREAIAAERERDYLRWRMREIIPLFEEARDALCAISLVAATAYHVDLSLGARMDAAGTRTREEFDAMHTAAEKEQPQ